MGPQDKFYLKKHLAFVIIGIFLVGLGLALTIIPMFTESMKIVKKIDENLSEEFAGDFAAFLYNFSYNCGDIIGPFFGGYLTEEIGFVDCSTCMGIISFVIAIVLMFSIVCFDENEKKKDIIENNENNENKNENLIENN